MLKTIDTSIENGVIFLLNHQKKDGSFSALSSQHGSDFSAATSLPNTFIPILILECLASVQQSFDVKKIKKKLADFVLSQKSNHWTWNYWVKNSEQNKSQTYPDDLDDTFCALSALYRFDTSLFTGEVFSKITQLLINQEVNVGGPYRTWLVTKRQAPIWQDADLAVNINVGYFLSLVKTQVPNIEKIVENALSQHQYNSAYYERPLPILYFIGRWYQGSNTQSLLNDVISLQKQQYNWGTSLDTALALATLTRLNAEFSLLKKIATTLLRQQSKNGSWPASALFPNPIQKKNLYYAGSQELTTAFCLESLSLFKKFSLSRQKKRTKEPYLAKKIENKTKKAFRGVLPEQANILQSFYKKIQKIDHTKNISLFPYFFFSSLRKDLQQKIPETILIHLGTANLLGWMAYTVYDDFLDDEGEKKYLPLANICLRELTCLFSNLLGKDCSLFRQALTHMANANMWEVTHCRIPQKNPIHITKKNIPNFASSSYVTMKSYGHILGPQTMLYKLGYKDKSPEFTTTTNFFIHYLTAKQLDDDAHDWKKDLLLGQINPMNALVLSLYFQKSKEKEIVLTQKNIQKLETIFWNEAIDLISKKILYHCGQCNTFLKKISIIENNKFLLSLIKRHQESAIQAIQEKKKVLDFLEHASSKTLKSDHC